MQKPIKCGDDYLRGSDWAPITANSREHALRIGEKLRRRMMKADVALKRFHADVFEAPEYYRVSFGGK